MVSMLVHLMCLYIMLKRQPKYVVNYAYRNHMFYKYKVWSMEIYSNGNIHVHTELSQEWEEKSRGL